MCVKRDGRDIFHCDIYFINKWEVVLAELIVWLSLWGVRIASIDMMPYIVYQHETPSSLIDVDHRRFIPQGRHRKSSHLNGSNGRWTKAVLRNVWQRLAVKIKELIWKAMLNGRDLPISRESLYTFDEYFHFQDKILSKKFFIDVSR